MGKGRHNYFTRLYLMELSNPTGLIQDSWRDMIEPIRQNPIGIIRKILKVDKTDEAVLFYELSIVSQCRAFLTINRTDLDYLLGQPLTPNVIKRLADHIGCFSLVGIRPVSKSQT